MTRQRVSLTVFMCVLVVATALTPAVAAGSTTTDHYLSFSTPDPPSNATVGEAVNISGNISVYDFVGDYSTTITTRLYVNGSVAETQSVTISDGETTQIAFSHTFNETGPKEVYLNASGTIAGVTVSADSPSVTINITSGLAFPSETQATGASFTIPPSLQDEVDAYRDTLTIGENWTAFVLAEPDQLYIVFTDETPTAGRANVSGAILSENITYRNLTFGVIGANSANFTQNSTTTTVGDVTNNSSKYELEVVEINATHRRVSTLSDPDQGNNITVATSMGVLVTNPPTAAELFNQTGTKASEAIRNSTRNNSNASAAFNRLRTESSQPHLATVNFETEFWASANVTATGIVVTPGSAASKFVQAVDSRNVTAIDAEEPVLYVVNEQYHANEQANVTEVKRNADSLDGEVISLQSNLYQSRFSVQELLEEETGCSADLLQIQTPNGPVCLDVVQDVLIHAGVAWNDVPTAHEDVMVVVGASARHQDSVQELDSGQYRIVGEVVDSSRVDESLPNASVLVVYQLNRTGSLELGSLNETAQETIENATTRPVDAYRAQLNRSKAGSIPPLPRFENPPEDTDGDGVFDDVNGDGTANIVDVQALYATRENSTVQGTPELFDVNGDGVVDIIDVQALYAELTE